MSFLDVEGFRHVFVAPWVEAFEALVEFAARGEEDDGDRIPPFFRRFLRMLSPSRPGSMTSRTMAS